MFSASWWDSKFCFRSEPIYGPKEHSYSEPFWVVKDIGNQFVSAHFGKQKKKNKKKIPFIKQVRSEAGVENLLNFLYCSEICFVRTTLSSSLHQCNPNPTKASNTHHFASDMEYRKIKDEVKSLLFFFHLHFPNSYTTCRKIKLGMVLLETQ
jgi:hypothetical protein